MPIGFTGQGRGHEPIAEERALEVIGRAVTCEKEE